MKKAATKIFVSYSPKDEAHKHLLDKHLSVLKRLGVIESFDAGKIKAGEIWQDRIQQYLNEADIILLLLSADAIADDYIHDKQIQKALERAKNKEAVLLPILLRSVAYKGLGVEKYAILPSNGKAVTSWNNQDNAYQHIAHQIGKVVENIEAIKSGRKIHIFEQVLEENRNSPLTIEKIQLPSELATIRYEKDTIWIKSLKQQLLRYGVSVGDKPSAVFQHYGWLIATFLQKMNTNVGKERTLRRLSFMAEVFQSSIRYLCYIQLAQLLNNQEQAAAPTVKAFFEKRGQDLIFFDWLNFLITTDDLLPNNFVAEIPNFVAELSDTESDLYGVALFLEKNRRKLLQNAIAEDEQLDQLLDEYLAALVFWLRNMAFLAKYRLVSIKDINLNYRLGSTKNFVHLYGELHGMYSEIYGEDGDFVSHSIQDFFTYNKSVLLFKGTDINACLNSIGNNENYLSLSPLIIDQSVFVEKETQTPEIYYYTGKAKRRYLFAQYKNELTLGDASKLSSNKTLKVQATNISQPKLDELFEQIEQIVAPFQTAQR